MKKFCLLIGICSITFGLFAQHANIVISSQSFPNEPSIFVNPANTNQIVAGANINAVYYSHDAGLSWNINKLSSSTYGVAGDPVIVADTAGNFYYLHLSNPFNGSWLDQIVCQKSTDGGQTWNDGAGMGLNGEKDQDKEWVAVDPRNNNIYVCWTQFDTYGSSDPSCQTNIMFSKSTNAGDSFSPSVAINQTPGDCIDEDNTVEGAVPAVGPNGEIFVAWAGHERIYFTKSLDEGETWANEQIIAEQIGGWAIDIPGIYRCNGMPVTRCDLSGGPYHGRVYVNWADQRNGENNTDIWMIFSDDGGESWSEPLRINDDPTETQQFFSWMDVDQSNGKVYCVFYDRRNYDDLNTDVYMAMSNDGGQNFINFKVSETPFVPSQSVFFGDYTNVSAFDDVVRPIWCRMDNGQTSILTAIVDTEIITHTQEQTLVPFSLEQNYPNPFRSTTTMAFKVNPPQKVSLSIFDMTGNERIKLIDEQVLYSRKNIIDFKPEDYDLAPGIYYFSLNTGEHSIQRKMIFIQ